MPQWQAPAPQDPTAAPFVDGGFLRLNPRDVAGLHAWFQESFQNQLRDDSWFTREWFPQLLAPLRKTLNSNFKELTDHINKSREDVLELREEVLTEVAKAHKEMTAAVVQARADMRKEQINWVNIKNKEFMTEVAKMRQSMVTKCNDDLNTMRTDLLKVLRREMADEILKASKDLIRTQNVKASEAAQSIQTAVDTTHSEMMTAYNTDLKSMHAEILDVLRRELAQEIIKMRGKKK
jgi:hypothetical protein